LNGIQEVGSSTLPGSTTSSKSSQVLDTGQSLHKNSPPVRPG